MRILHVTHQYRPAVGGAEQYITNLSEELVRRGHQVDVYTSRSLDYLSWRNVLPRQEMLDGVRVQRFTSFPRTRLVWKMLSYGLSNYQTTCSAIYEPFIFLGNGPLCPGMFAAVLKNAPSYNLVHINNLHYAHAAIAYAAAKRRGLPAVITPHVHKEQRETHDIGYLSHILSGADLVLADTIGEKEYLLERGWNEQVAVAGHGLRVSNYPPLDPEAARRKLGIPEGVFVILFLGRKTEYKGLDLCVQAFVELRRTVSDAVMVAAGPETEYSQKLWTKYAGQEGLLVRDTVSDDERLAALAACDVLALPSTGEAFGIVYLEAWAYHKPVIGAAIASVSSVIADRSDGILVEPGAVSSLAEAFKFLAQNPEEGRRMGERGSRKLEKRYTVEHITDVVEAAYLRVLRHRRTTAICRG